MLESENNNDDCSASQDDDDGGPKAIQGFNRRNIEPEKEKQEKIKSVT